MSGAEQRNGPEESCPSPASEADERGAGRELRAVCEALRNDIRALDHSLKVWLITAAVIQGALNALIRHIILFGV